jgi:putative lipoic acid-binding regulatory protein
MGRLAVAACILLLGKVQSFSPEVRGVLRTSELHMAPPNKPAGSFFHQIPDEDDEKETSKESAGFDEQVSDLIKQRRKPPLASKPSTINGVPTATGFGKPPASKEASKPYVAIGPQDPPVNNPSKPEFDDQGYTLYTDKETGKKARVFEALVDYPCDFTMKIVGRNEGTFVEEIVAVVAEACESQPENIPHSVRAVGKWTSITVHAPVKSSEMLYSLYEKVDLDPRVKFKF